MQRNWLLGYRIAQEELKGEGRSEYGTAVIRKLAKELTAEYGKGFDYSSLYKYFRFYKLYPEIVDSVSPQSGALLSWTHYRVLLQVEDKTARDWYTKEAANQTWSVRTLQRNISSQYYYRLLKSQNQEPVKQEMEKLTADYQADKLEFIKNPMITEFLGLSGSTDFTESKLESCIITNIQKFLMELGKGYAFVARQQHIHTEKEDYYIDLGKYDTEIGTYRIENNISDGRDSSITDDHLIAYRLCKEEIMYNWVQYLRLLIKNHFAFAGTMYNEDNLFQQRIPDQLWENIRTFIINLKNLPVWKDRSMAATIFGGKNKYDFWKIIFQTGKTSDGTQVLVVPLNVADMIKK